AGDGGLHAGVQSPRDRPPDQETANFGARLGAENSRRAWGSRDADSSVASKRTGAERARREAVVALPCDPSALRFQVLGSGRRRGAARLGARVILVAARFSRRAGIWPHGN